MTQEYSCASKPTSKNIKEPALPITYRVPLFAWYTEPMSVIKAPITPLLVLINYCWRKVDSLYDELRTKYTGGQNISWLFLQSKRKNHRHKWISLYDGWWKRKNNIEFSTRCVVYAMYGIVSWENKFKLTAYLIFRTAPCRNSMVYSNNTKQENDNQLVCLERLPVFAIHCCGLLTLVIPWWRHQMEKKITLLALCAGNSPVTGEFPSQRPLTRSFDVFV